MNVLSYLRHCFLRSHARGKRVSLIVETNEVTRVTYACPRCGKKWDRVVYRRGTPSAPPQA